MTFMNLSGGVIGKLVNYYKIQKSKIIIVHDDIDLEIGKIKIKTGGLRFTCTKNSNATNHDYPRATDPDANTALTVENITDDTLCLLLL